jgi:hypothetical protein
MSSANLQRRERPGERSLPRTVEKKYAWVYGEVVLKWWRFGRLMSSFSQWNAKPSIEEMNTGVASLHLERAKSL